MVLGTPFTVKQGIEVVFDQWHVRLGDNLQSFMERGLSDADRVVVVCTDTYNKKVNEGKGGVGFEKIILTDGLVRDQDTHKFIPVIRGATGEPKTPRCLLGRRYLDLSDDSSYEERLNQLADDILDKNKRAPTSISTQQITGSAEIDSPQGGDRDIVLESSIYFDECFRRAFPGLRGIEWFDDQKTIVDRLAILLGKVNLSGASQKVWWWAANGDCPVNNFERIDSYNIIIDSIEIKPIRMAAINLGTYYQKIIYVQSQPFEPSGVYPASNLESAIKTYKYYTEEYAVFNGNKISREEYDDGATMVDGVPVEINSKAELRLRYLTPWNFFIAPHGSPINTNKFDAQRKIYLEGFLDGSQNMESFAETFNKLPKRPW